MHRRLAARWQLTAALEIRAVDPIETIEIAAINRDVQVRVKTDRGVVDDYHRALVSGAVFPPIVVFRDKKTGAVLLADGNHRLDSRIKNGETTIDAEVREGGRREALAYAVGSSKGHGLRFSNADKRNAVTLALKDSKLKKLKDTELADLIGVSQPFVWKLRGAITVIKSEPAEREPERGEPGNAPAQPDVCERLIAKFRRLLGEVPEQDRSRFGEQVLELLSAEATK
jgi:hypothetical protein